MDVKVECYAGGKSAERPVRLRIGERRVEVASVLDRWYGPDHEYWKIQGSDGWTYLMRFDRAQDSWDLRSMSDDDAPVYNHVRP